MSARLDCVEFQRLNDMHERSRGVWLRYAFPLPGQYSERLDGLKREALLDRILAARRMTNDESPETCPICRAGLTEMKSFVGK
jgi:hypothetical protein